MASIESTTKNKENILTATSRTTKCPIRGSQNESPSSDLLERLNSFLPKIAAANQDLKNNSLADGAAFQVQINSELDDSHDDCTTESDDNDDGSNVKVKETGPRVEMTVSLGDFDNHPIIPLLESNCNDSMIEQQKMKNTASGIKDATNDEDKKIFLCQDEKKLSRNEKRVLIEEL